MAGLAIAAIPVRTTLLVLVLVSLAVFVTMTEILINTLIVA
jgi:hypothetical protein